MKRQGGPWRGVHTRNCKAGCLTRRQRRRALPAPPSPLAPKVSSEFLAARA